MANRYWIATSDGNWSNTANWSTTEGGSGGASVPTSSDDVFFGSGANGNCNVNVFANCNGINFNGGTGYTGTLSMGTNDISPNSDIVFSSTMTITSTTGGFDIRANLNITTNGLNVNCSINANNQITLQDDLTCKMLFQLNINPNGKNVTMTSWQGNFNFGTVSGNFNNLSITSDANKTRGIGVGNNIIVNGNLTINGNSAINRLLVRSNTLGTQRTITCNGTVTVTNADFQDIKGAGSGSWDLSAITGGSGDCGGNTDITFTTPVTTTCSAGTTWSTATWSSRVPLPQDTAKFSGSSRTITQDMPRIGSVDFTGSSGLTWATSNVCRVYGSINLTDLGTLNNNIDTYIFEGRGSNTLTSAGKIWYKVLSLILVNGSITLGDNLVQSGGSGELIFTSGTFNANNYNVTTSAFSSSNSNTRTLSMGDGTWILYGNVNPWTTTTTTNLTLNKGSSTIKLTGTLTTNRTFNGGGLTYNNFENATAGNFVITIAGSNTFNNFKINPGREQRFTAGTTQTVNTFDAIGTSGSGITLSSTSTSAYTLAKAGGGTIQCEYVTVSRMTGSPVDTWYMGENSTDGGNNTNVYFTNAPVATNTSNFFLLF